jgi:hypothetical protein
MTMGCLQVSVTVKESFGRDELRILEQAFCAKRVRAPTGSSPALKIKSSAMLTISPYST